MKFGTTVVLRAAVDADITEEVIEALLDALHDVGDLDAIDAVGSLASRDLTLTLEVAVDSIEAAQASTTAAVRQALHALSGSLSRPLNMRPTEVSTRELATA